MYLITPYPILIELFGVPKKTPQISYVDEEEMDNFEPLGLHNNEFDLEWTISTSDGSFIKIQSLTDGIDFIGKGKNGHPLEKHDYWRIDDKSYLQRGIIYRQIAEYIKKKYKEIPKSLLWAKNDHYKEEAVPELITLADKIFLGKNYNGYRINVNYKINDGALSLVSIQKFIFKEMEDEILKEDLENFIKELKENTFDKKYIILLEDVLSRWYSGVKKQFVLPQDKSKRKIIS